VSHHFDSPTAIADGRINLCDLFVFPGAPGTTTLILTVNPDAGRSSATTFRPDAAARLAGLADPDAHAEQVQTAFLPDVVRYQPGQPASFQPGGGNGRALDDDTFDIAVAVLAGSTLGNASVPRPPTAEFPYLSAPRPAELPALADLFGLRDHRPE
jgi:hypothetical protein